MADTIHKLGGEEVNLTPAEKVKLEGELKEFWNETKRSLGDWFDACAEVPGFMRGLHMQWERGDEDTATEEENGNDRIYPNVPYLPSRIDRMVQYIRHEEAAPVVRAEEGANFPVDPASPERIALDMAGGVFDTESDNETVARLLTARLDRLFEKADCDKLHNDILEVAAQERTAFVMLSYEQGEDVKEPLRFEILRPGDIGYDPKAKDIDDCRWIYVKERNVLLSEIEKEYGVELSKKSSGGDSYKDTDRDDESEQVPDRAHTADVFHWWVKNPDTKTVSTADIDVDVAVDPETGEELVAVSQEASTTEVYAYKGGWQYVVVVNDRIVTNRQSPTPTGRPPIHSWAHREMPRSLMGISMYDQAKDANIAMDRLQAYAVEAAYKMQPKTLLNKAGIKNVNSFLDNDVGAYVDIDVQDGQKLADNIMYLSGAGASPAVMEMFDRLVMQTDELLGVQGIQMEEAGKAKLSGDAIEGLAADREGVGGRKRDRWYKFLQELYADAIEHIIAYEDVETTLRITGQDGKPQYVDFNFGLLRFDGFDFEATWDVVFDIPRNLPKNPVRRGQYLMEVIQQVSQMADTDPEGAMLWVDVADIPYKDRIQTYLAGKLERIQAQAMAQMQQGEGGDPGLMAEQQHEASKFAMQLKKDESESEMRVRASLSSNIGDALEEVAKTLAKTDPVQALALIEQIPGRVMEAWTYGPTSIPQTQAPVQPGPEQIDMASDPGIEQPPVI